MTAVLSRQSSEMTADTNIVNAYAWWLASLEVRAAVSRIKSLSAAEVINVMARWLISRTNGVDVVGSAKKAAAELRAVRGGRSISIGEADGLIRRAESLYFGPKYAELLNIARDRSASETAVADIRPLCDGKIAIDIRYLKFRMTVDQTHFDYLCANVQCSIGNRVEIITAQLMRYEGYISYGQAWAYPAAEYVKAMENLCMPPIRNIIEAFTSPFNSQLPGILARVGSGHITGRYCSMLPGDRVLGSLGSFFDLDITTHINVSTCLLVNPPFIEDILLLAAQKCIFALESAKKVGQTLSVVFITPEWTDAAVWAALRATSFRKYDKTLSRGAHCYEEQFTRRIISAKFDSHLWLLTNV
jgi:hypothetical protein